MIDYEEWNEFGDADELAYQHRQTSRKFRRDRTERRELKAARRAKENANA